MGRKLNKNKNKELLEAIYGIYNCTFMRSYLPYLSEEARFLIRARMKVGASKEEKLQLFFDPPEKDV